MPTLRKILLLTLFLLSAAARADQASLDQAEKLYQAGEWEKARQLYKAEASSGTEKPGAFYFNYGTIAAKAGSLGEAYVALLHAAFAHPFDSDTLFNLHQVEKQIPAATLSVRPALWFSWWPHGLRTWPSLLWALLALVCSGTAIWLKRVWQSPLWLMGAGFAFLFLAATGFAWMQERLPVVGAVSAATVKSGPGTTFSDITTLDPGTLVNKEATRGGWLKVRFRKLEADDDTVGWLEPSNVIVVR